MLSAPITSTRTVAHARVAQLARLARVGDREPARPAREGSARALDHSVPVAVRLHDRAQRSAVTELREQARAVALDRGNVHPRFGTPLRPLLGRHRARPIALSHRHSPPSRCDLRQPSTPTSPFSPPARRRRAAGSAGDHVGGDHALGDADAAGGLAPGLCVQPHAGRRGAERIQALREQTRRSRR